MWRRTVWATRRRARSVQVQGVLQAKRTSESTATNTALQRQFQSDSTPRVASKASAGPAGTELGSLGHDLHDPSSTVKLDRKPLFDKILIANRGEIACRVIRTAKKHGIRTVAVYSDADRNALHVQMADEAHYIGPAPSAQSYLRMDVIIRVALESGAQAVHPGYGFLSENATFARKLQEAGIIFIGPPDSAIVSMGSKSESKDIMNRAGVSCVPGYHGQDQSPEVLRQQAALIGYPVLIKAVMGGGGKGMRIVDNEDRFFESLESARRESQKAFGDQRVLVEKYITEPRHIEVQVFGDKFGNIVSLWERDCSVQRRHQKIIEEAPAPGLAWPTRAELGAKAVAAARAVGYHGAGTVEFIYDNNTSEFYFMEMNTRLQVEHPITEMITGLDLVLWQLEVAAGNPLPLSQADIPCVGHSFEARIYAENPNNNFLPDVGPLLHIKPPILSDQVRLDSGFNEGSIIDVHYDPLISKLIIHGESREACLLRLRRSLAEFEIAGVSTNIEFLRALAKHPAFIDGKVETGFIEKYRTELFNSEPTPLRVFVDAALCLILHDTLAAAPRQLSPWERPSHYRLGRTFTSQVFKFVTDQHSSGSNCRVSIKSTRDKCYDIVVDLGATSREFLGVRARMIDKTTLLSEVDGTMLKSTVIQESGRFSGTSSNRLTVFHDGTKFIINLLAPKWQAMVSETANKSGNEPVVAPMPSMVVDIKVREGDVVEPAQALVVLESMKTEIVLRSNTKSTVRSVLCRAGDMVGEGDELVTFHGV